ncbi:conserved Plasmodium protein, unknown function [Plasmodium chabaudi chabaudi]|uniref:Uncharacterized protein n=1 Tax=Plasmodium chabaudi chabaudi TaxID=31271 RepID=A0A1C6X332_PLACU|nr:conserved Plasmodium protein, unknown function [Plasmodium chabaudi chabaudi]
MINMKGGEESEFKKNEEDNNNILCYVKWITNIINGDDVLKINWDDIEFEKSKKRKLKIKEREEICNEKKKKKNDENSGITSLYNKSKNIIGQWKSLYNIKSIKNWTNKNEFKDDLENDNSLSSCSTSEIGSEGEGNKTGKGEDPINGIKKKEKKNIDYTALSSYINEMSLSDESDDHKNDGRDTDLISYNTFEEIINKNKELDMIFFHNLNIHGNNDKEKKETVKNEQNAVIDRSTKNNRLVNVKADFEKESNNKIVGNKLINNIKNENINNRLNLKLEPDFDPSKRMENNNFCFWNMENETYITRPLYANQLNKKSYTLLDESEEMIKQFSSNQYSIKFVPRHLLYSVSQVASRTFFDPLYRKQLFF